MAQPDDHHLHNRTRGLKLNTHPNDDTAPKADINYVAVAVATETQRPQLLRYPDSEDTIRACATPPIEIPGQGESPIPQNHDKVADDDYINRYLKRRNPSLTFNSEVRTSSGHRHPILDPRQSGVTGQDHSPRGRSLAHALSEQRNARPHSESDRSHYDSETGRQLPQFSDSPPYEEPHVGEARFPLLQETVDALARKQSFDIQHLMSMTSESTMSPVEEVIVTPDGTDPRHLTSPIEINPSSARHFSSSYGSPLPRSRRKASERWREGEATADFFARAGSFKKSANSSSRRSLRRDGPESSFKSPTSVASSYLRGFSVSSAGDDSAPPPVDAEGSTVGDDYVLGKQIGYGGFSIIREVKQIIPQTGQQRTLAVKIVRKQIDGKNKTENDAAQTDFEHEVDLWRLLNHKHILSLEAVYELNEATFCFIPLNTGGTLFDIMSCNRQGLALDLAANYSYQLASALRYLHLDARVVHRDIKLENCLIDTTNGGPGLLRLCDFGLAEWISNDNDSNSATSSDASHEHQINKYFGPADSSTSAFAGGSLEYAAPEILQIANSTSGNVHPGDSAPVRSIVSPAVDIWAMGVCVYALVMGRRPFADTFQPRVVMAILAGDWNRHSFKERAGDEPYRLVRSCLAMDAYRRPGIGEVILNPWFNDVRSSSEHSGSGSDAGSESARTSSWRL